MSSFYEAIPKDPKEWLLYTALATAIGGIVFKSVHTVEQGEKGVITRNGRPIRVVGTGPKVAIPPIWHIKNVNVKDRTSQLKDPLFINEGQYWKADASVFWHVMADDPHPINSLFEVEPGELDDKVRETCNADLDKVFRDRTGEVVEDLTGIKERALKMSNEGLLKYGVKVEQLNIYNPTAREAEITRQAITIGGAALSQIAASTAFNGDEFIGMRAAQ